MTGSGAVRPRTRLRPRPSRLPYPSLATALLLLAASLGVFAALAAVQGLPMDDIRVYRAEGAAVWHGTDLYGFTVTEWDLPATYPPFAALLFVPVALVPLTVAKVAFVAGNVALLAWLITLSLRAARPNGGRAARPDGASGSSGTAFGAASGAAVGTASVAAPLPAVVCLTAAALWLEPVFQTVAFGQINLLLACLVLWDMGRPDAARAKGFALGLAAGVKLTPALFAVHLLLTGRFRAACWAAAGFAASVAVGACALPGASVEFWTRRMFETARVGKAWIVDNQSLQGLAARLLHETEPGGLWLAPTLVLAVGGMWLARRVTVRRGTGAGGEPPEPGRPPGSSRSGAAGERGELWGIVVTALVALLVSPISWSHHWVWCVPLLAALATTRSGTTNPAGRGGPAEWGGPAGPGGPAGRGVPWPRVALGCVAVVFTARTLWLVPKEGDLDLRLDWWQQPLASPYPLLALALLGVAAGYGSAEHRPAALTPRVPPARIDGDGHAKDDRTAPPAADGRKGGRRPECEEARGGRCAKHDAGHSADRDPAPGARGARARDVPDHDVGGDGGRS